MDIKDLEKQPINLTQSDYISVGVTWVQGSLFVKPHKPQARLFYGVCHRTNGVFAVTPDDYKKPLAITTIIITPPLATYSKPFCEKGHMCIHFDCLLNKFDKDLFVNEFHDCGLFSLALPKSLLEKKQQWFNTPKMINTFWEKMCLKPEGGVLYYDESKHNKEAK